MLIELCRAFEIKKIPYVLVGGHALALHGMKRTANRPEDQLDIAKLEEAIRNEKR